MELEYVNFALGDSLTVFVEFPVVCMDQQLTNRKFTYSSFITPSIHYNLLQDWPHKE
jgi:hypothetical protein